MDPTNRSVQGNTGNRAITRTENIIIASEGPGSHGLVHWGPIWAGVVSTLTVYLLLQMFLYWAGSFVAIEEDTVIVTGRWISLLAALISFFLGGWIATTSTDTRGAGAGILNGFLVWAAGTGLILTFSILGAGQVFGVAGTAFNQFLATGGGMTALNNMLLDGVEASTAVTATRAAAGWGSLFLVLAASAAMLGGWLGDRTGLVEVASSTTEPEAPTT